MSMMDDHTKFSWSEPLHTKDEAPARIQHILTQAETAVDRRVKTIRSDNGGEFINREMATWANSKGIKQETTLPGSPQQNGPAERLNRTTVEASRAMLTDTKLPTRFWSEAVRCSSYIRNRAPVSGVQGVPYTRMTGSKPDVSHMRVFGCPVYYMRELLGKFERKAEPGRFVGYAEGRRGYRILTMDNR